MFDEPIHVTDGTYQQTVLDSKIPVIVDFWAPWCGPCKMVAPILDKFAKEFEGKLIVAKINTDENQEWMMKYGIQGIPTMLFVADGKIVHRQVGALPERMLPRYCVAISGDCQSILIDKGAAMKKIFPALVVLLLLGACSFNFPIPGLATPTAVIATTAVPASPVPSPLPSPTPVLLNPSNTPSASTLPVDTATFPPPNLTTTLVTATEFPLNLTATLTPTAVPGLPTASLTLGVRLYGTLPPEVPFTDITVLNKARAEAYISLQVTLNDGRYSILEYPVPNRVKIKAPLGRYIYVVWVGGNKLVGSFRLQADDSMTIYLYKDRVVLR